jgi:hypothetical protein
MRALEDDDLSMPISALEMFARGERRLNARPDPTVWTELERTRVECELRGVELARLHAENRQMRRELRILEAHVAWLMRRRSA